MRERSIKCEVTSFLDNLEVRHLNVSSLSSIHNLGPFKSNIKFAIICSDLFSKNILQKPLSVFSLEKIENNVPCKGIHGR